MPISPTASPATRKERSLSIMRDHEIGTYGVIALMLSLAMRATAIALIAEPRAVMAALIAADAASRLSAVLIMAALPPARQRRHVRIGRQSYRGARCNRARGDLRHRLAALALRRRAAPDLERRSSAPSFSAAWRSPALAARPATCSAQQARFASAWP